MRSECGSRGHTGGQDTAVAQQHFAARVLASWRNGQSERSLVGQREPAVWIFAAQIQEQFGLAETVGSVHVVLFVFLQELPG